MVVRRGFDVEFGLGDRGSSLIVRFPVLLFDSGFGHVDGRGSRVLLLDDQGVDETVLSRELNETDAGHGGVFRGIGTGDTLEGEELETGEESGFGGEGLVLVGPSPPSLGGAPAGEHVGGRR